jgi:hypothetical protein
VGVCCRRISTAFTLLLIWALHNHSHTDRNKLAPLSVRKRAATIAIQYESPKLAVTGYIKDDAGFAAALERALSRSNAAMKVSDGEGEIAAWVERLVFNDDVRNRRESNQREICSQVRQSD